MRLIAKVTLIGAVACGFMIRNNPLLFGKRTGESHEGLEIITEHPGLDNELALMSSEIGEDYEAYRNHCLRVFTFTKYFLPDSVEKEIPNAIELVAVALAHHDSALWTAKTLNYLEPSAKQLDGKAGQYNEQEIDIMKDIVLYHHKVTDYKSNRSSSADELVNAVRKADWADATIGVVRFGLPAVLLEAAYDLIPEAGFHMMLVDIMPKLSPDSLVGQLDLMKIFKW